MRIKYPRTYHLPWSESITDDDKVLASLALFQNQQVVVTEKMDGENTTMYQDYIHARSIDGRSHPSIDWVKGLWSSIRQEIPKGWRLCGENLWAKHSIHYHELPSYFMGFSIWDDSNVCLSWQDTVEWLEGLGLEVVPTLYTGIYDEKVIRSLWKGEGEGYVVRLAQAIPYAEFQYSVGKFVRRNHVQTDQHWMYGQALEKNILKKKEPFSSFPISSDCQVD